MMTNDHQMTIHEAAEYLGMAKLTLDRKRWDGSGPKYMKLGSRTIRYSKKHLDEWLESQTVDPSQDAA